MVAFPAAWGRCPKRTGRFVPATRFETTEKCASGEKWRCPLDRLEVQAKRPKAVPRYRQARAFVLRARAHAAGCRAGIRTPTKGSKDPCATVTPLGRVPSRSYLSVKPGVQAVEPDRRAGLQRCDWHRQCAGDACPHGRFRSTNPRRGNRVSS